MFHSVSGILEYKVIQLLKFSVAGDKRFSHTDWVSICLPIIYLTLIEKSEVYHYNSDRATELTPMRTTWRG